METRLATMNVTDDDASGPTMDADLLLEFLTSQHDDGVLLHQLVIPASCGALLHSDGESIPLTEDIWSALKDKHKNPLTAPEFEALHTRWRLGQDEHMACKQALLACPNNLFLRLLAFIADLVDYQHFQDVQDRMDFCLPTATALFQSPLYFTQPHESEMLNAFVSSNGQTILQIAAARFERAPHLEGVCTAHTLAPLLMRLFAINDDSFSSKHFKEFRKEFNKSAGHMELCSKQLQEFTGYKPGASNNKKTSEQKKTTSKGKKEKFKASAINQLQQKNTIITHAPQDNLKKSVATAQPQQKSKGKEIIKTVNHGRANSSRCKKP